LCFFFSFFQPRFIGNQFLGNSSLNFLFHFIFHYHQLNCFNISFLLFEMKFTQTDIINPAKPFSF
jgi:hypothetical protein